MRRESRKCFAPRVSPAVHPGAASAFGRWARVTPLAGMTLSLLVLTACGGISLNRRQNTDVVVLVADPEGSQVGQATVRAQGREVVLDRERLSTRAQLGRPPSTPALMSEDEIQRRFAEAMAARPLPPRDFVLYFETATETLTAQSQAELQQIVAFVRTRIAPDVSIVGHTDTTDSAAANIALGLRRATLVRDQLLAAGLPQERIDTASHGEADPIIKTDDNVAEARNRRVEVIVR